MERKSNRTDDMVKHPNHYRGKNGLEAWDVIEAFTSDLTGIEAFDIGNVLKYICRWKHKNGIQDLLKAKEYLDHVILRKINEEINEEMPSDLEEKEND